MVGGAGRQAQGVGRRTENKLTAVQVRRLVNHGTPGQKAYDGGGLHVYVTPARTALWRVKYRWQGKERLYHVGLCADVGLEAARAKRDWVKEQLREGRDPVQQKRMEKAAAATASGDTFDALAKQWLANQKLGWSPIHYEKSERALERDVLPYLGRLPVAQIKAPLSVEAVKGIARRGARETAGRILQHINGIFRLAQALGMRTDNPAESAHEALPRRTAMNGRNPAFTEWADIGALLRNAEAANLTPSVRLAHRLCAFIAVCISNIVEADWREFNLDSDVPIWIIPRRKMKVQGQ
ncbi:MAG TPA: integrase arm-type DNA-binding domain-containing protein, partial [Bradyrhizobium sp.]|nr:integrase arm-type DNA-binding domain-containing protein [Bradyrhizobium sp.]